MDIYSENIIHALKNATAGDDKAIEWLEQNGFPELSTLAVCLRYDDGESFNTLAHGDHKELAAFSDALCRDDSALNYLLDKKFNIWAAVANYALGDEAAYEWLIDNHLDHYAQFGVLLKRMLRPRRGTNYPW